MVNLKHLSKSCWNHLASWPYWKTLLHRRRWREGYIRRGTCACAACESEVLTEKSPDVSSHTTWTMYAFPRNGKLYDGFSSSGVWKFHVKDTVLKRSSFWSLAKRTRKRGTGFAFFGRELPSGCLSSETLHQLQSGIDRDNGCLVHAPRDPEGAGAIPSRSDVRQELQGQRVRRVYPGALLYSKGEEGEAAFRVHIWHPKISHMKNHQALINSNLLWKLWIPS